MRTGAGIIGKSKKKHDVSRLLTFSAIVNFILAVVLIVVLFLSRNESIRLWYDNYIDYLSAAENKVEHLDDKLSIFLIIEFLFIFKALFPIYLYPLSALCAVTSTVFPAYLSIPINVLGLCVMYSTKYYWGKKVGASGVQSILQKNEAVQYLIEKDGNGNPLLLSLFRMIPGIPVNQVSKLYGAMEFPLKKFLALSLLGYSPLLVSYTFIGRNVFNPLSAAFLVPSIIMFIFIGSSLLAVSKIYRIIKKRRQ